jgi:hypothetical protein
LRLGPRLIQNRPSHVPGAAQRCDVAEGEWNASVVEVRLVAFWSCPWMVSPFW